MSEYVIFNQVFNGLRESSYNSEEGSNYHDQWSAKCMSSDWRIVSSKKISPLHSLNRFVCVASNIKINHSLQEF